MVTHRAVEETSASSLTVMSPSSSSRSSRPSMDLGTSSTPMSETTDSKAMYRPIIQDFPVTSRIISEIIGANAPPMIEPSAQPIDTPEYRTEAGNISAYSADCGPYDGPSPTVRNRIAMVNSGRDAVSMRNHMGTAQAIIHR